MNELIIKEFYEKATQDPILGKKLEALSREYDEKLRALVAEAGYELEEVVPLSDEEVDVVGGISARSPSVKTLDMLLSMLNKKSSD